MNERKGGKKRGKDEEKKTASVSGQLLTKPTKKESPEPKCFGHFLRLVSHSLTVATKDALLWPGELTLQVGKFLFLLRGGSELAAWPSHYIRA